MKPRYLVMLAAMVVMAGCGEKVETPTSATTATATTILFAGTLQPRATRFYSYTLTTAGTVTAMLASLERNGAPVGQALDLGLGVPAGTGCAVQVASSPPTPLVPQLRQDAATGTYCVRISDVEGLPAATAFTIRVVHP